MKNIKNYYVFYVKGVYNFYDRTFQYVNSAEERVEQLKCIYEDAFYKDTLDKEFKYYY